MDFNYDENQQMLYDSVDRFLTDRHGLAQRARLMGNRDAQVAFWHELAELGLMGAAFPEELGGYAASPVDVMVVLERLGRHLVTAPFLVSSVVCGRILIAARRDDLVEQAVSGELRLALVAGGTHALRSPQDNSFEARREGEGWVLSGRASVVPGADLANRLIVAARTSGQCGDHSGITLFLVPADAMLRRYFRMIDGHGAAEVAADRLVLDAASVLGTVDEGLPLADLALDHGIAGICAEALGSMGHLVPATAEYARTREQYGAPLAKFQVLQHRMADMYVQTETARSMAYVTAMKLDGDVRERRQVVSSAKFQIGKSGKFVGYSAVQVHGGMGVSEELDIGHHHIRLTTIEKMFGDGAFHLRRFHAEHDSSAA